MKVSTILGLSAIGAAYYAHRRRGGVLTLASARDSATALGDWAKSAAGKARTAAREQVSNRQGAPADASITDAEEIFPSSAELAGGDARMPKR